MIVIPAIDIKNGKCVRLIQGDPGRETVYSNDPVEQARTFERAGAKLIHVVDLDGAFAGLPVNVEMVKKIAAAVNIPIEIGGGIRSVETARLYYDAGIRRFVVGTAALEDYDAFKGIMDNFGDFVIAGVDAKSAMVATQGWLNVSDVSAVGFISALLKNGVKEVIYTDISTDGMLKGPNLGAIDEILKNVPGIGLIASGGVGTMADIESLKPFESAGLKGCIVGKAIYDGRIELTQALAFA
jgi:phosphoribosylformimino-5-aminoimidazole carboxamide ribotide isomerase